MAETGAPVTGATVRLGSALAPQTTDARGAATFARVPAGTYLVALSHPQLGARTVPAVIAADGPEVELRVPAAAGGSMVAVVRSPVRLAAVRATATRGSLQQVGYLERKRQGIGVFMDGDAVERHHGAPLSTALRGVSGIRVVTYTPVVTGTQLTLPPEHRILPSRGTSTGIPQGTGTAGGAGAQCFLAVFLDGIMIQDGSTAAGQDIDANVLNDVAAIEVYRGASEVPTRFRQSAAGCGAVLLWTKVDDAGNDRTAAR
jgi:hypothetical protein